MEKLDIEFEKNKIMVYTVSKRDKWLDVFSHEKVCEIEDTTTYFLTRKDAVIDQKKYFVGGFIIEHNFNIDEIQDILDIHNSYRNKEVK